MDGGGLGAAGSGGGRWSGAGILGTGGGAGTVIMGGPIIMFGGAAAMFGTDHCCGVVMNGCVGDIAPGPIIIMGFITGGGAMGMGIAGGARKPGQPAARY